ncbi:MAG: hypothetical protein JJU29_19870 [Verrucomicrobia bacterium]|nr:hypothetical protein [Verrucomicrobiota bacterium]MCH8514235.1 hypothetical protein [Kiritimatiellia bacterium]
MKKRAKNEDTTALQFVVVPNTGLQICRNIPPSRMFTDNAESLWKKACNAKDTSSVDHVVRLLKENLSVYQAEPGETTPWIRCDPNEDIFWRMIKRANTYSLDIVVDTNHGAGKQYKNKILCELKGGVFNTHLCTLASIYVEQPTAASGCRGCLIVDFGNTASAAMFSPSGKSMARDTLLELHQPFDPRYKVRSLSEVVVLHSNICFLNVPTQESQTPWIVTGERARELIKDEPDVSYVFAPKKFIRHWAPEQEQLEPSTHLRGVVGHRDGLIPVLSLVRHGVNNLMGNIIGRLVNPKFTSHRPELYPIVERIMLTYPLTWRKSDREVFKSIVEEIMESYTKYDGRIVDKVEVELICSEPVAVASFLVWESLFQYGVDAHQLVSSTLGNVKNEDCLRLLILDIGGGSTDIAVVDVGFTVYQNKDVDVTFKMVESMRFNRAGDRITHLIVTALLEYVRKKHMFAESLGFEDESNVPGFNMPRKRVAVSKLTELAEAAKKHLSTQGDPWVLTEELESDLLKCFEPAIEPTGVHEDFSEEGSFTLDAQMLESWIRKDHQCMETNGEPGFMDVFFFMRELCQNLKNSNRMPHSITLTGRTCRLPLIQKLAVEASGLPHHRVRTLEKLLPMLGKRPWAKDADKLAVVQGAHRFRFGDNVRFIPLPEEKIFNRYIGSVMETPDGLKLNNIYIEAGDSSPRSLQLQVFPGSDLRVGNCFRKEGIAETIAVISNLSQTEPSNVTVDVLDDFTVRLNKGKSVKLIEWVPGGGDIIADNFNDNGRIDGEPQGFISDHVVGC